MYNACAYQFRMTHHCDVVIPHGHGSATVTSTITIYCEPYSTVDHYDLSSTLTHRL